MSTANRRAAAMARLDVSTLRRTDGQAMQRSPHEPARALDRASIALTTPSDRMGGF